MYVKLLPPWHSEVGAGVHHCLDQDPMAQLHVVFWVAQQPPGPEYNMTPSGAALHSITGTDGAGCKASRQQDLSGSQAPAKIAISFAWSCSREEEARTQLQTKDKFQIK